MIDSGSCYIFIFLLEYQQFSDGIVVTVLKNTVSVPAIVHSVTAVGMCWSIKLIYIILLIAIAPCECVTIYLSRKAKYQYSLFRVKVTPPPKV